MYDYFALQRLRGRELSHTVPGLMESTKYLTHLQGKVESGKGKRDNLERVSVCMH